MKKFFIAFSLGFLTLPCGSQNLFDQYREFLGFPSPGFSDLTLGSYQGEYQIVLPPSHRYMQFSPVNFKQRFKSYKVEVVSFPFIPDHSSTLSDPLNLRILHLPPNPDVAPWDAGLGTIVQRVYQSGKNTTQTAGYYDGAATMNLPSRLITKEFHNGAESQGGDALTILIPF